MAEINENWSRWINASICDHFITEMDPIYAYVEGMERFTDGHDQWVEIRVDGPNYMEWSRGQYRLYVEVNLALVAVLSVNDPQKFDRFAGRVAKAFKPCINVYKYGDQDIDDKSILGTLRLVDGKREEVKASRSGIVEPRTPIVQATIEGHYEIYLEN